MHNPSHMDHLITYEEAVGFLKNPPMLAPHPNSAKIRALCKHILMALKQLACLQSAIHKWLGLVMNLVMYALIKPTTLFVLVADPGNFPVYNNFATKAAIKMTNKRFERDKKILLLFFVNINRACFCMLNDNIADQFKVSNTPNMTAWNSSMSICSIIDQLEMSYGKPNTMLSQQCIVL
jgi:hypothetical protein